MFRHAPDRFLTLCLNFVDNLRTVTPVCLPKGNVPEDVIVDTREYSQTSLRVVLVLHEVWRRLRKSSHKGYMKSRVCVLFIAKRRRPISTLL